ncbi:two-component regulator propeller domain-containing protein [Lewinella sp. LCG006]|uniref:hybrid sensor histidine kinase/response regulator transcription factor n=1 Tax=Lewinella sp. LCG006 TaxID=3231911 RepID=UPI00346010B3
MKPNQKLLLPLLCILLQGLWLPAQSQYRFEQLTAEQGFSQSITYELAQDSFGNIWTATEEGVVRFNSQETFRYHTYVGLPANYNNRIRTICIDRDQNIWIGAENGVALYYPEQDAFQLLGDKNSEQPHLVRTIITDQNNQLWIGAYNGLWRYLPEDRTLARVADIINIESLYADEGQLLIGAPSGLFSLRLSDQQLTTLLEKGAPLVSSILRRGNQYLVGTKTSGLFRADVNFQQITKLPIAIGNSPVNVLLPQKAGSIYVGTDGSGLWELDENFEPKRVFRNNVDEAYSLSSDGVYDLLLDREGILWVATYGGGVNMLNPVRNNFYHLTHRTNTQASIAHPFSRAILEDDEGRIWFGTKNGISIWSRGTNTWRHLLQEGPYEGAITMALTEDEETVWAGTYNYGLFRINKKTLAVSAYPLEIKENQEGKIFTCKMDQAGDLWLGGINGPVQRVSKEGEITNFAITQTKSIIPARDGGVWVAGRSGLSRIKNGQPESITALNPSQEGFRYTTINCILEKEDGALLLGTNGAGLIFYDPNTETVQSMDMRDGLPSDIVQGILMESEEVVWLSTTKGLVRLQLEPDTSIQIFDQTDGLLSTEFNYGSFAKLRNGQMLFGGVEGVTLFDPKKIKEETTNPLVVFEEFRLFNQVVSPGEGPLTEHLNSVDQLVLKHRQNSLTINFAGVSHVAPAKVQYRWKLDGLTEEWSAPSTSRQTNFTNLAPGEYIFRVQAANRDGYWGPERQLAIIVTPPWWATTLAFIIYGLLGIAALLGLLRISALFINKRNAEQQIAFFNNITHELKTPLTILLSSLEGMTNDETASSEQAKTKIQSTVKRLTALFEQLLNFHKVTAGNNSNGEVNPFMPAAHIRELTDGFQPLLRERELSLEVINHTVPAIFYYNKEVFDKIIFNLVSNAVKYSKPGGAITINIARDKHGDLQLEVKDQGIGIPSDQQKHILNQYYRARNAMNSQLPGTGLGLMMVKSMIKQEGGDIRFTSTENVGTTFFLELKNQEARYQPTVQEGAASPDELNELSELVELKSAKILVVEDNDELRELLVKRLGVHFTVSEASNGIEGLEKASEIFPDLIITDLIMPEMDGMEMCRAIQEDINLNHIPIFMLTVLHNSRQKVESIKNGVSEYMEKPINFNLLLAKISNTLTWRQKMRQRYGQQVEIEQAASHRQDRESQFINELEQFVLQEVADENFSVQDLCKYVGMSRTSLYMKLKNLVDLSPQDFIIHTRLKYARQLLTEGEAHIKEVAYRCGFSNPKYFSTSFKKKFGESPRSFRKKLEN